MKTLFLDFDGVLHPYSKPDFRHAHHITALMERFPELHVVVHSSWRFAEAPDGQAYTVAELGKKVGCALFLDRFTITSREILSRWESIDKYLHAHQVVDYVIVDDEPDNFPSFIAGSNVFIITRPDEGLTLFHVEKLTRWLQGEDP